MSKFLTIPLAILIALLVAVATATGILIAALLSPVLDIFNHQPTKFYNYEKGRDTH